MGHRYNWQESSIVRQMDVIKSHSERIEAIIYAPQNADAKLAVLPQYLMQQGFVSFLDQVEGKNVLKVVEFKGREQQLLGALRSGGFVSGEAAMSHAHDKNPQLKAAARLKRDSLNVAGILGDTGHAAGFIQGILQQDKFLMGTVSLYGAADAVSAIYGNGTRFSRFPEMVSAAQDDLARKGIKLQKPSDNTPVAQFRRLGSFQRAYYFAKTHPVQWANMIGLAGDIALILSGKKAVQDAADQQGINAKYPWLRWARFYAGLSATAGALVAIFVPEKTPEEIEEDKKKTGLFNKITSFIGKRPLAIQGAILSVNNALGLLDALNITLNKNALNPKKPGERLYKPGTAEFGWARGVAYTTSGVFRTISSEHNLSIPKKDIYNDLYAQAANALLGLPEGDQDRAVKQMAFFLSTKYKHEIRATRPEIEEGIRSKLAAIRQGPWGQATAPAAIPSPMAETPAALPADAKKESKLWMEQVRGESMAEPTPSPRL